MLPLQHAQQLHQGLGVKPASNLDATAARHCHRQTTAPQRRRVGGSHLYRQPAPSPYGLALRLPLPIAGQRGQTQPVLPAELNTAQPAAFVLARHLLSFRAGPPAPGLYPLRLIVHPSTESPTAEFGQMGWSNAYPGTELTGSSCRCSSTKAPNWNRKPRPTLHSMLKDPSVRIQIAD